MIITASFCEASNIGEIMLRKMGWLWMSLLPIRCYQATGGVSPLTALTLFDWLASKGTYCWVKAGGCGYHCSFFAIRTQAIVGYSCSCSVLTAQAYPCRQDHHSHAFPIYLTSASF